MSTLSQFNKLQSDRGRRFVSSFILQQGVSDVTEEDNGASVNITVFIVVGHDHVVNTKCMQMMEENKTKYKPLYD